MLAAVVLTLEPVNEALLSVSHGAQEIGRGLRLPVDQNSRRVCLSCFSSRLLI